MPSCGSSSAYYTRCLRVSILPVSWAVATLTLKSATGRSTHVITVDLSMAAPFIDILRISLIITCNTSNGEWAGDLIRPFGMVGHARSNRPGRSLKFLVAVPTGMYPERTRCYREG